MSERVLPIFSSRSLSKHVYYLGWNRSPAQVGCMRQVLRPGALGRPRGIGWRGKWEGRLGWEIHVNPWLIHVNVWQKLLQYCKVISLQLIKINGSSQCTRSEHLSHASNLGWWSVSPLMVYMFRWCSLETSHPRQVEREVGGGIGMGNTCISMADSCQCMTKTTKK